MRSAVWLDVLGVATQDDGRDAPEPPIESVPKVELLVGVDLCAYNI